MDSFEIANPIDGHAIRTYTCSITKLFLCLTECFDLNLFFSEYSDATTAAIVHVLIKSESVQVLISQWEVHKSLRDYVLINIMSYK